MLTMLISMADGPEEKRKIELLYEQYNKLMYKVAYNILNKHEDAEDALIASWEKIIKHLDKINEIECQETKSFIVIIVERTSIDLYRKEAKRRKHHMYVDEWDEQPYMSTRDTELENAEIYEVMRKLPKKYAEALILYYVNGMKTAEIADVLKVKESVITKRLSRGRNYLREELDNDG